VGTRGEPIIQHSRASTTQTCIAESRTLTRRVLEQTRARVLKFVAPRCHTQSTTYVPLSNPSDRISLRLCRVVRGEFVRTVEAEPFSANGWRTLLPAAKILPQQDTLSVLALRLARSSGSIGSQTRAARSRETTLTRVGCHTALWPPIPKVHYTTPRTGIITAGTIMIVTEISGGIKSG